MCVDCAKVVQERPICSTIRGIKPYKKEPARFDTFRHQVSSSSIIIATDIWSSFHDAGMKIPTAALTAPRGPRSLTILSKVSGNFARLHRSSACFPAYVRSSCNTIEEIRYHLHDPGTLALAEIALSTSPVQSNVIFHSNLISTSAFDNSAPVRPM